MKKKFSELSEEELEKAFSRLFDNMSEKEKQKLFKDADIFSYIESSEDKNRFIADSILSLINEQNSKYSVDKAFADGLFGLILHLDRRLINTLKTIENEPFYTENKQPNNRIEDELLDIAGYVVIALHLLYEGKMTKYGSNYGKGKNYDQYHDVNNNREIE